MKLLRITFAFLFSLLLCSRAMALQCEATPAGEGNASEAGTPGPLRFYQPTASVNAGANSITLVSTAGLASGDMLLIIQMQGLPSTAPTATATVTALPVARLPAG